MVAPPPQAANDRTDSAQATDDLARVVIGGVVVCVLVELVNQDPGAVVLPRHPAELLDEDAVAKGVEPYQVLLVR